MVHCHVLGTYLTVQSQEYHHEKEEDRPERRARHLSDCLGVCNESKTRSGLCNISYCDTLLFCHEAQNGEDDKSCQEAGPAICAGEHYGVSGNERKTSIDNNGATDLFCVKEIMRDCYLSQILISICFLA